MFEVWKVQISVGIYLSGPMQTLETEQIICTPQMGWKNQGVMLIRATVSL